MKTTTNVAIVSPTTFVSLFRPVHFADLHVGVTRLNISNSPMLSLRLSRPLASATQSSAAAWTSTRALHATPRNSKVHEAKSADDLWLAVKGKPRVVVDCFATWCGPCKAIAPVLETMSEELQFRDKVHFVKFDVDRLPQVTQELGVRAMPTFVMFKDGVTAGEVVGADPRKLAAALKKLAGA
ncbi:thioredoxin domain-containing protein [Hirsutella rhossiliensis]|uniref:Thioredoxin domain-containing protein n=1 Tax=Hirsutella rhossiliensis TaxID=111463 RepID=A0A9P8N415_9HYPO|nr:thioredoxin domain-containing protein [Hirsutella rhossiliensis]KAH0966510.1 thioredoxin domain-containing protein [Hirsutella rhossiliensis]